MKRFHFPLRPVKILRSHRELRAREIFAASVHTYVQTEQALALERQRVVQLEQLLSSSRKAGCQAGDAAALFQAYRAECAAEIAAERAVIEARSAMNQRREEYIEANRQLKVVNQLADKARFRHRAATLHSEQVEMDDLAGLRARRRTFLS
jgi:flagellar export protein FliJ